MNVVHQLVAHIRYIFQRSKIIRKEWFELLDQHTTQINFGYSLPDLVCLCSANKTFAKMPSPTTCSMSYSAATSVTWWLLIFKKRHFTQRFVFPILLFKNRLFFPDAHHRHWHRVCEEIPPITDICETFCRIFLTLVRGNSWTLWILLVRLANIPMFLGISKDLLLREKCFF